MDAAYEQMMQNPELMKSMMNSMTPEMMQMAANMAPSMGADGAHAAEMMKNMTKEDLAAQLEQMKNMDPSAMRQGMQQQQAQLDYAFKASETLKADGNSLVKEGKFDDAADKYERAKNNLASNPQSAAKSLRVVCMLNLSHCHLKRGRNADAIKECDEVLTIDRKSLKAFYRRGLARQAAGELPAAVADLRKAHELSEKDEAVKKALEEAEKVLQASGASVEDVPEVEMPPAPAPPAVPPGMMMPGGGPPDMEGMMKMMKENPDMMKQAAAEMEKLSPEQLAEQMKAMKQMTGRDDVPEMTPEMAKMAAKMMENMTPEDMESMASMAKEMEGSMGPGGAPDPEKAAKLMANPKVAESVSKMMQNMDADTLAAVSSQAGMNMSKEQAEQMANVVKNIKPGHIEKVMAVVGWGARVYAFVMRNKAACGAVGATLVAYLVAKIVSRFWGAGTKAEAETEHLGATWAADDAAAAADFAAADDLEAAAADAWEHAA